MVATLDGVTAYKDAEFVIVAAPTNYDPHKNFLTLLLLRMLCELLQKSILLL